MTQEDLEVLPAWRVSGRFNDLEKLALEYAEAMTQTPVVVPDPLFRSLQQKLSPAQIVELTAVIAHENYRARFNHALDIGSAYFLADESKVQGPKSKVAEA